jgi:hypothetical protein
MLTADDVKDEDWSEHSGYPKSRVVCDDGHQFMSRTKFSGWHVAIISETPCPVCGTHSVKVQIGPRHAQGKL